MLTTFAVGGILRGAGTSRQGTDFLHIDSIVPQPWKRSIRCVTGRSLADVSEKHYLSKAGKEPGLLVFILPFKVLQKIDRTAKGIKQVDNGRTVAIRAFRFELEKKIEKLNEQNQIKYLILRNSGIDPILRRVLCVD